MPRSLLRLLTAFLLLAVAACGDAPGDDRLRSVVDQRLGEAFAEPLIEIASIRRLGRTPLPADESGAARTIVYYNARLSLARDYAFGDWEALNPSALASLLGASERGIEGIRPGGNRVGDELRVRGSVTFRREESGWMPVEFVSRPAGVAPPDSNTGQPAMARRLADQILGLFDDPPPGDEAAARTIITEELAAAGRQISRRIERLQRSLTIAGGPAGGEYDLVARTVAGFNVRHGMPSAAVESDGSVENVRLLRAGTADLALVQSDIAALAFTGEGPFDRLEPATEIQALATLFPEPVHVVVQTDSDIRSIADLRGRRIDLGLPGSGTRRTGTAVLQAHGLGVADLRVATEAGAARAAALLRSGSIDGFMAVISAPARILQRLAVDPGTRLIPLQTEAVERLITGDDSLVRLTLPAGTYPRQRADVPTVAVTALLVARADMADHEVKAILDAVFDRIDFVATGSAAGALISRDRARDGLSIPLHPAAEAFFTK